MRARLARPRRIVRGRLVAPIAAAAAVALVGGVVVATPDAPTVRQDVQTVANTIPGFEAGASYTFNLGTFQWEGATDGFTITEVKGLPEGLTYKDGVISGIPAKSGTFPIIVTGKAGDETISYDMNLVVTEAGASAGSAGAVQGSLGGEAQAGGQVTTGSDGTDALLGAVASIVVALGGDAGSVTELATGSTGGTDTEAPTGPLGSLSNGVLGSSQTTPGLPEDEQTPGSDSLGSSATGEAGGEATGGLNTESLGPTGPLGSVIDTETTGNGSTTGGETTGEADLTTGGELSIPGSSTTGTTGSLGDLAPGLALTGAALLGLAGLSIVLNGGSSTPGVSSSLPSLPGSSTTAGGNSGSSGSGDTNGGSTGSTKPVVPIVAAGKPNKTQAPGPTVANGRG